MLKTLKLENFTVFPKAELEFSPGLNVIVGENGTGKSHLLKLGYAVLRAMQNHETRSQRELIGDLQVSLRDVFKIQDYHLLWSFCKAGDTTVSTTWGESGEINFAIVLEPFILDSTKFGDQLWIQPSTLNYEPLIRNPLFIPPKEILSIYKGLRSTLKKRELDFDATYLDLAESLDAAPYTSGMLERARYLFTPIEQLVRCSLRQVADGSFYFEPLDSEKEIHPAHMAAEGYRKLAMLAYLIKNGELAPGSSLFWDEPEANLNPKLQAKLAEILVELSNVMQITIATHSLFLLREIEILQEQKKIAVPPKFFGLHFNAEGGVEVTEGISSNDIGDIAALDENLMQSERYMELAYQE